MRPMIFGNVISYDNNALSSSALDRILSSELKLLHR